MDKRLHAMPSVAMGARCPPWCRIEHLGEAGGTDGCHHDGEISTVVLDHDVLAGRRTELFVNVSLQAQTAAPVGLPLVELQDERRTLARLTPGECVALSRALLKAATTIAEDYRVPVERLDATVAGLEETLSDGHPVRANRG